MRVRNGFVSNSSSSSFIIVGGSIDFEGESLSFEKFSEEYLALCIFGGWFEYDLKDSHGKSPKVDFVADKNFVQSFRYDYGIVLPLSCKDKYEQLRNKILSIKYTNKEDYVRQVKEKDSIKDAIVDYCRQLLEPEFRGKEINVYDADDHSCVGDESTEDYVRDLFYGAYGFYKKSFNNH